MRHGMCDTLVDYAPRSLSVSLFTSLILFKSSNNSYVVVFMRILKHGQGDLAAV